MEIIYKLGNKVEALPILPFVDILFELTKMFKTLGKTLSLAFSGIYE